MAADVGPELTIGLTPRTNRFDPEDDRWLAQEATLYDSLRQVGRMVRHGVPVPGTRGGIESVIIALGSAGAFQAAVSCLRAWLARDMSRGIHLICEVGDQKVELDVQGSPGSQLELDQFVARVVTNMNKHAR